MRPYPNIRISKCFTFTTGCNPFQHYGLEAGFRQELPRAAFMPPSIHHRWSLPTHLQNRLPRTPSIGPYARFLLPDLTVRSAVSVQVRFGQLLFHVYGAFPDSLPRRVYRQFQGKCNWRGFAWGNQRPTAASWL